MILLVLAIICLGAAAFLVGELITQPAQDRQRFFRRVATYGQQQQQVLKITEESLKARVGTPIIERSARLVLRVNPKTTIDGVAYKLVSAGMSRRVSPTTFLALKGICPIVLGLLGIAFASSQSPLMAVAIVVGLGALGF